MSDDEPSTGDKVLEALREHVTNEAINRPVSFSPLFKALYGAIPPKTANWLGWFGRRPVPVYRRTRNTA